MALSGQIQQHAGAPPDALLTQTEDCFRKALRVFTRQNDPVSWAKAQQALADVLRRRAPTTKTRERIKLLDNAVAASKEALRVLKRESSPLEWAETQFNYGLILHLQAQIEPDAATRRGLYSKTIAAQTAALSELSPESTPALWARAQRSLGAACVQRADIARRTNKYNFLAQAVRAYQQALSIQMAEQSIVDIADTQSELGLALRALAANSPESERVDLYRQAAEAFRSALTGYTAQQHPIERAGAESNLAASLRDELTYGGSGAANLTQAVNAYEDALTLVPEEEQDSIRISLAEVLWTRALAGPGVSGKAACEDLVRAHSLAGAALQHARTRNSAALSRRASTVRADCESKAAELGCNLVPARASTRRNSSVRA